MLGCHSTSALTAEDHIGFFSSFWLVVNSNPQIFLTGMAAKATSCAFDLWLGLAQAYACSPEANRRRATVSVPLGGGTMAGPPSLGVNVDRLPLSLFVFPNPLSLRHQMLGLLEWDFH